jgi:hypothetical protein
MNDRIADDRAYAAVLARRYFYERSVSIEVFAATFEETSDPLIAELLELVLYEPSREGMAGVHYDQYVRHYWPHVAAVLRELERGEEGGLPAGGRFSRAKLIGLGAFVLFAAAVAIEHLWRIRRYYAGQLELARWELVLEIAGAAVMSIVTIRVAASLVTSIRLYRAARARRAVTP